MISLVNNHTCNLDSPENKSIPVLFRCNSRTTGPEGKQQDPLLASLSNMTGI